MCMQKKASGYPREDTLRILSIETVYFGYRKSWAHWGRSRCRGSTGLRFCSSSRCCCWTSRTRSDRMTILPYYVLVMLPLQSKRKIQKPYFLSKRSRPPRQYWAGRLRAGRTMPQTGVLWRSSIHDSWDAEHCWYCTAQPTLSKFLSDNFLGRHRSCRTKTEWVSSWHDKGHLCPVPAASF